MAASVTVAPYPISFGPGLRAAFASTICGFVPAAEAGLAQKKDKIGTCYDQQCLAMTKMTTYNASLLSAVAQKNLIILIRYLFRISEPERQSCPTTYFV